MIITDKAGLLGRPHTWPPWNTVRLNALNDEWMLFVINHTEKTRWQKIDLLVVVFYLWATNFFTSIIILFNDRSIATFCAPKTNLDKLAQIFFFQTLQLFWYMYQQSLPLSLSLVPGGKLKFGAVQWTYLQEWNFWNI